MCLLDDGQWVWPRSQGEGGRDHSDAWEVFALYTMSSKLQGEGKLHNHDLHSQISNSTVSHKNYGFLFSHIHTQTVGTLGQAIPCPSFLSPKIDNMYIQCTVHKPYYVPCSSSNYEGINSLPSIIIGSYFLINTAHIYTYQGFFQHLGGGGSNT